MPFNGRLFAILLIFATLSPLLLPTAWRGRRSCLLPWFLPTLLNNLPHITLNASTARARLPGASGVYHLLACLCDVPDANIASATPYILPAERSATGQHGIRRTITDDADTGAARRAKTGQR